MTFINLDNVLRDRIVCYSRMVCFRLSNSSITVSSFNGDYGNYQLVIREDGSILRTRIQNNYLWMEVDNWSY